MRQYLLAASLVAAAAAGTGAQTPAARPGTGAISGVVIDAVTERPVAGAIVWLRMATTALRSEVLRTVTDDTGRFLFRQLGAADGYTVHASKGGYFDGAHGQVAALGSPAPIPLADGAWFGRARIRLWKPGAISGRVLDERGEPVVGAFVRVLAQQLIAAVPHLVGGPVVRTDDRGDYRAFGLTPGTYVVSVPSVQMAVPAGRFGGPAAASPGAEDALRIATTRTDAALDVDTSGRLLLGTFVTPPPASDGRPQAYPTTFFPSVSAIASATRIALAAGETREHADIALQPVVAGRITGTVSGPPEAIAGLMLRLISPGLEDLGAGSEAALAVVAADGRFTFLNVPPGAYTIEARRATSEFSLQIPTGPNTLPLSPGNGSYGTSSSDVAAAPPGTVLTNRSEGNRDFGYWARTPVTIAAGETTQAEVALRPVGRITGRIVFDTSRKDLPPRAPLRVEPADGSPATSPVSFAQRTQDQQADEFAIEGLLPGEYVFRTSLPGFAIKTIIAGGQDYARRPFDTSRLSELTGIVVTVTDKLARITGTVKVDRTGDANAAAIIAFPASREAWTRYGLSPERIKSSLADPEGAYRIDGLPAGDYFLIAVAPERLNAWQDPVFLEKAAAAATRVSVEWGETRALDLSVAVVR